MNIVDIEKQRTAGSLHNLTNKFRLWNSALRKPDISRRIFNKNLSSQHCLQLIYMGCDNAERFLRIGQWQEIVEKNTAMTRPC